MKAISTFLFFLTLTNFCFSQITVDGKTEKIDKQVLNDLNAHYPRHNMYAEGSFILQSINFETKMYPSKSKLLQINARLGLGYFYFDFFGVTQSFGGLLGTTALLGRKDHHFETSIGGFVDFNGRDIRWLIATIGYRYQKPQGGFMFRSNIGTLGPALGLGYAF